MDESSLADLLKSNKEELERLTKELRESNEKLIKESEKVKELSKENVNLEEMLENSRQDHLSVIESYEQEKYSMKSKLTVLEKMESQYESSLQEEQHKSKSEIALIEGRLSRKHTSETNALKKQIEELHAQIQHEKLLSSQQLDTIAMKNSQLDRLNKDFRNAQTSLNDTIRVEFAELSSENYELKVLLQEKEVAEHDLTQAVRQLREEIESGKISEENLKHSKTELENELSTAYELLESCREECQELQAKFLSNQPDHIGSKGNSLFAEVEDKRVRAEKNLVSLTSKYKCLQTQNDQLKNHILKLKMQISALLETRSRTIDQHHVRSLEDSLSAARADNLKLLGKMKSLQEKSRDMEQFHDKDYSKKSAVAQFMENELKEMKAENARITEELRLSEIYLINETRKISGLERDLYERGRQLDIANSSKYKMQLEIDRLKMICSEGKFRSQHKVEAVKKKTIGDTQKPEEKLDCQTKAPPADADKENERPQEEATGTSKADDKAKSNKDFNNSTAKPRIPLAEKPIEEIYGKSVAETSDLKMSKAVKTEPSSKADTDLVKEKPPMSKPEETEVNKTQAFEDTIVTSAADCKQQ